MAYVPFVPLRVYSAYTILEGAIEPKAIGETAKKLGFPAISICDRNGLYGVMPFQDGAKSYGVQPIIGALLGIRRPTSDGKFIRDWGAFDVAHAVAVDKTRIYVADRENARIQIFDHSGKLAESRVSPAGHHTYSLKPLGEGRLLAVEGRDGADRKGAVIRIYAADGAIEASYDIGLPGKDASLGHDLAIGPDGHIYVADVPAGRVVRFQIPPKSDK
mgnify:CR=1 FL=1